MGKKKKIIRVNGQEIAIYGHSEDSFISLTDLCKGFEDNSKLIEKWINNKGTVEYLGVWETLNNENFNSPKFGGIRNLVTEPSYYLSVKKWIEETGAKGIIAKAGRYGGTYAHSDIAMKFCSYLSPAFELYVNQEFQKLKKKEENAYGIEWKVKRVLTKVNYKIQTDAIKEYIIPKSKVKKDREWLVYANEADMINVAVFGFTAKEWRESNPSLVLKNYNPRDTASINELVVVSNMENLNSVMIKSEISKALRFEKMKEEAKSQLDKLNVDFIKSVKNAHDIYPELEEIKKDLEVDSLSDYNKKLKQALDFDAKQGKKLKNK